MTMSVQEKETRDNFSYYMADIVSKKGGDVGAIKDPSFEATIVRANKAIEGAKKYVSAFG